MHEGFIKYSELLDGTISLEDLAIMNESIDSRNENQARVEEALKNRG